MRYLRVKNWERLQQQSTKRLPWIKLFTELLEPTRQPEYAGLTDVAKATLHHIWLMAAVFCGRIPEDWLTRERLNLNSKLSLESILESGYIWWESEDGLIPDSSRARIARSENLSSAVDLSLVKENLFSQDKAFDAVWAEYPRRIGRKAAQRHFAASVKSEDDFASLRTAMAHANAEFAGREMRFIPHGSAWFNGWRDWVDYVPSSGNSNGRKGPDGLVAVAVPVWTIDDIRTLKWEISQPEWSRSECSRDDASAYIALVQKLFDTGQDVPSLVDWLAHKETA